MKSRIWAESVGVSFKQKQSLIKTKLWMAVIWNKQSVEHTMIAKNSINNIRNYTDHLTGRLHS